MFVKSFFWLDDDAGSLQLVIQRIEPNGLTSVTYSPYENLNKENLYDTNVKDFYVKENYLFTTKMTDGVSMKSTLIVVNYQDFYVFRTNWSCISLIS